MFEFFRKRTRLLLFILVVLIIPSFVFFGIEGYTGLRDGAMKTVATVDGQDITQGEWDNAHRNQVERMRQQMPDLDAALLDTPAFRQSTLDALVRQRVMLAAANKQHLVTSDERLARLFRTDPQLAFLRNPDGTVNSTVLQAQGMSSAQFAERLRQDYSVNQVMAGIDQSALAPASAASAALDAYFQQRQVQVQQFDPQAYLPNVKIDDAEVEAFYKDPANGPRFRAPEQAEIEYVVLDLATLAKDAKPSEEELRKFYDENIARYSTPSERRASHILIKAERDAKPEDRNAAKAKAESLLAQAKAADAAGFAALAKANSQDTGSAVNGGDLDWFGRDAMVKPFEEAAFALQPGATSDVVESDFGFHIIRVTGARGGERKSFDSVRAEIETQAREQQAQKRYAEAAEQFTNTVYEQPDSLKPAADALGLSLQRATVQRQPAAGATGALASPKLLGAIFADDTLRNKRNTEAVETGSNQMAAARVIQHQPARQRTLDEVRDQAREAAKAAKAAETARKAGEARLALGLKEVTTTLGTPILSVSRAQPADLPPEVLDAALQADASKLPAWIGVDLGPLGYTVLRVEKVLGRDPVVMADAKAITGQYAQAWTQAEAQAFYAALKDDYKVKINLPSPAASAVATP